MSKTFHISAATFRVVQCPPVPYLECFEQEGSADIVSLISGGAEVVLIRAL